MLPGDKLTIEIPELTVLEFPLAGIGSRSLALAIDSLLQFAVLILVGVAAGLMAYAGFCPANGETMDLRCLDLYRLPSGIRVLRIF